MDRLVIEARFKPAFAKLGLKKCGDFTRFFSEPEPPIVTTVFVKPASVRLEENMTVKVFYKQYEYQNPSWKFVGRPSKAWCEYRNYAAFRAIGIPTAQRIACGEQRDWLGRLRRAFIITEAIPNVCTLSQFFESQCPDRSRPESRLLRQSLVRAMAGLTSRLHGARFFHHDLVWRNILVTCASPSEPKLWWIDCPRGRYDRWSPWRRHRLIKDLASLDKSAARYCSRGERLDFIRHYLAMPRLDAEAKRLVRDTLAYRKQRWPDDCQ